MAKILTGSTLSYGTVLPAPDKTSDGGMFFLLNDYTDLAGSTSNPSSSPIARGAGLYVYSFQQDVASTIAGDQVGQRWKQVSSLVPYLPLAGGTLTGGLSVLGSIRAAKGPPANGDSSTSGYAFGVDGDTGLFSALDATPGIGSQLSLYINGVNQFSVTSSGAGFLNGAQIWTSANMGSGSGLNADLLDGLDSSYFLNSSNQTGVITVARGGTNNSSTTVGGILYGSSSTQISTSAAGSSAQLLQSGGTGAPTWVTPSALIVGSALAVKSGGVAGGTSMVFTYSNPGGSPTYLWGSNTSDGTLNTPFASANVTVGTATNALALGGNVGSVSATPNTLVLRDGSGYTYSVYTNQSSPNSEGITVSQVMVTNGSDNFLRKVALSSLVSQMNLSSQYLPLTGGSLSGSLNVNSISLNASTNSISVPGNSTFGNGISVNGSATNSFNANVLMNSALTVNGNILANGSNMIASTGQFIAGQAGSTGLVKMTASGSGNSGYIEFYGGTGGVRSGYIGNAAAAGSTDAGVITYVAATHQFSGNLTATGNITAYSSDARLKTNIVKIESALDKVLSLGGYSYDWDLSKCADVGFKPERKHEHGLIAQEVQKVMPDAVAPAPFDNEYLTVRYERLVALLVAAMGEQQSQINALAAEIEELKGN